MDARKRRIHKIMKFDQLKFDKPFIRE
jgi:hypothetical protein